MQIPPSLPDLDICTLGELPPLQFKDISRADLSIFQQCLFNIQLHVKVSVPEMEVYLRYIDSYRQYQRTTLLSQPSVSLTPIKRSSKLTQSSFRNKLQTFYKKNPVLRSKKKHPCP